MISPGSAQQQHRETHNVSAAVMVEGKDVAMNPGGLVSISIYHELNKIPTARMIFSDGAVDTQRFDKSNDPLFTPGKKLEIQLGYDQKQETLFKGIITRHGVKIQPNKPYHLEIECKDVSIKTAVVRKSRYFYSDTDSDIFKSILSEYSEINPVSVDDTNLSHEELVQYNVSDWDFLLLRADANGMFVLPKDGAMTIKKPTVKSTADLEVQFGIGSSGIPVLELDAEIDVRNHFSSVHGFTWDQSQQSVSEEVGEGASLPSNGSAARSFPDVLYKNNPVQLLHGGDLSSQELQAWVKSAFHRSQLSQVRGRITVAGIKIYPGDTVRINGVGDRFNGNHLVTAVLHQFIHGHWKSDIQFGWTRDPVSETLNQVSPEASGLVGAINGLQIGIVSAIAGDQQSGNHRIKVRLPVSARNPDGSVPDGIWARLGNVYAGKDHGFVFRPEIEDEVIVGFINNDPNDAVILGGLHNGKHVAPSSITSSDDNPIKGFISTSGLQLLFDDQSEKITVTAGSGGPSIILDGKGKKLTVSLDSSNSIEISSSGVKVTGTKIDLN